MLVVTFLLTGATWAAPANYTVAGRLVYCGSYPLGTWQGTNTAVTGQLTWDSASGFLTGTVQATVAAWDSGNRVRDAHARTMFEADRHPTAKLVVTGLKEPRVSGPIVARGTLTLHGVARAVELPGTLKMDGHRAVFDAEIMLRLTDYGMTQPRLMGLEVANDVKLQIHAGGATP
jgi:polyisoprenoid-binding protein YceI